MGFNLTQCMSAVVWARMMMMVILPTGSPGGTLLLFVFRTQGGVGVGVVLCGVLWCGAEWTPDLQRPILTRLSTYYLSTDFPGTYGLLTRFLANLLLYVLAAWSSTAALGGGDLQWAYDDRHWRCV